MLTRGPATSMCTSSSGPRTATEGAPFCREGVRVAILESATTPAASTDKIAGSDSPPSRSGPGRILTTVCGGSGVSSGKLGTAVSPCRQADTARTLSCGWGAGGGVPLPTLEPASGATQAESARLWGRMRIVLDASSRAGGGHAQTNRVALPLMETRSPESSSPIVYKAGSSGSAICCGPLQCSRRPPIPPE